MTTRQQVGEESEDLRPEYTARIAGLLHFTLAGLGTKIT